MNPEWHTITAARHKGPSKQGDMQQWTLTLVDSKGTTLENVYNLNKRMDVAPNMKVFGRVEEGNYGPRLFTEQPEDGSAWRQPNGQGPPSPSQDFGQPDTTDLPPAPQTGSQGVSQPAQRQASNLDARERRITRLHSQDMALRALERMDWKPDSPEQLKAALQSWADWFDNDGIAA